MNSIFLSRFLLKLTGLTAFAVFVCALPANAETVISEKSKPSEVFSVNTGIEYEQIALPPNGDVVGEPGESLFNLDSSKMADRQISVAQVSPDGMSHSYVGVRQNRVPRNYVGGAINIGLNGGDSSLGDGNFGVIGKVGVTSTISIRPSVMFGNSTTILLPLTYDFPLKLINPSSEQKTSGMASMTYGYAPYVGIGAALKTGSIFYPVIAHLRD